MQGSIDNVGLLLSEVSAYLQFSIMAWPLTFPEDVVCGYMVIEEVYSTGIFRRNFLSYYQHVYIYPKG